MRGLDAQGTELEYERVNRTFLEKCGSLSDRGKSEFKGTETENLTEESRDERRSETLPNGDRRHV